MPITPKGEAFVERMKVVSRMVRAGTPVFAAMAAGLEEDDWVLVYAATCKMARDVEDQAALTTGQDKS